MKDPQKSNLKMKRMIQHFSYTTHNLIGHPISEILHIVGLRKASAWIHEFTLPPAAKRQEKNDNNPSAN